jgi:hypothetical protein
MLRVYIGLAPAGTDGFDNDEAIVLPLKRMTFFQGVKQRKEGVARKVELFQNIPFPNFSNFASKVSLNLKNGSFIT